MPLANSTWEKKLRAVGEMSHANDHRQASWTDSRRHLMRADDSRMIPAQDCETANLDDVADAELVRRIGGGNHAALRVLMARHQVNIYRFIRRFIQDHGVAEDAMSDTFLAVWKGAARFESRSSVATWLLSIARYRALSARRQPGALTEPIEHLAATLVDPGAPPDVSLEQSDSHRHLLECIAALPADQGALLDLVYYHGKSLKEVAAILGVPENTVKTRMFRVRHKLAEMLTRGERRGGAVIRFEPRTERARAA